MKIHEGPDRVEVQPSRIVYIIKSLVEVETQCVHGTAQDKHASHRDLDFKARPGGSDLATKGDGGFAAGLGQHG